MLNEYTTDYIIPFGQTEIGEKEFSRCSDLERLYIPYYVTKIPDSNFFDNTGVYNKALSFMICGEKGSFAENYANEADILFEESTMWIKGNHLKAYFGKNENVSIPAGIETIRFQAFQYAPHISIVDFPNSVKYIESEAFARCAITQIEIPKSVIAFGSRVFMNCKKLQSIVFKNADTILDNDCFIGCHKDLIIKANVGGNVEKYAKENGLRFKAIKE